MDKLFQFLRAKKHWFYFIVLEIFALALLFKGDMYRAALQLYASNSVVGYLNQQFSEISSYAHLKEVNLALLKRNASLEAAYIKTLGELKRLESAKDSFRVVIPDTSGYKPEFKYVMARVVASYKPSVNHFYVIDKGADDGIRTQLGVMTAEGVMGITEYVGRHYSVVIPLINNKINLSCRLLRTSFTSPLIWSKPTDLQHGRLEDLPQHASVKEGDTVVTSGFSSIFPPNLYVGKIAKSTNKKQSSSSGTNIVKYAVDFNRLNSVYVLLTTPKLEVKQMRDSIYRSEK